MPFPVMTTTQQFHIPNPFLDKRGKMAPVQGEPVWASSNEAVAKVVPEANQGALVVAQGVGDYTISVSGDADLGEGVTTLAGQDSGTVTQGQATSVGLVAGPVEEQP